MRLEEKLAELRRRQGMSQEQLAERLGVTRQSVSKWESGAAVPELSKLIALSELFGVSVDYLVKDWAEEAGTPAAAEESTVRMERKLDELTRRYKIFRYTSQRKLFGLPLVDICFGHDRFPCRDNTAVGILAIGNFSLGVVSIGLISAGGISLGMLSFGLLALGMVALGVVAVGMTAIGVLALGMVSVGVYAFGASAVGAKLAAGLAASGEIAVGRGSVDGVYTLLTKGGGTTEQVAAFLRPRLAGLWEPLRELLAFLGSRFGA